jgi:hypothetical protein
VIGTTSSRWYSGDGAERALDIAGIGRFDSMDEPASGGNDR